MRICDGKHRSDKCQKVKTPKERKAILVQKVRCFSCLRQGHNRYNCRAKGRCLICGLKHRTSIFKPISEPIQTSNKNPEKQEDLSANIDQNNKASSAMTTISSTTKYTNALLQTALVTANGPDKKCQARILVDTGSQKTFVTQHLRKKQATTEIISERNA